MKIRCGIGARRQRSSSVADVADDDACTFFGYKIYALCLKDRHVSGEI